MTLDDGLWSVAMGVAAHRSIELGRPVAMSELLPPRPSVAPTTRPPPSPTRRPSHEHHDRRRPPTVEMSWFSALCDDDYEFLGQPDPALASSFEHCRNIVLTADRYGYDNVLLPSGYALGIDNVAFAAAIAPHDVAAHAARRPLRRDWSCRSWPASWRRSTR